MDLFEVLLKHLNGIQIDMKANCCNLQLYEENTCSLKNNILNRNWILCWNPETYLLFGVDEQLY